MNVTALSLTARPWRAYLHLCKPRVVTTLL